MSSVPPQRPEVDTNDEEAETSVETPNAAQILYEVRQVLQGTAADLSRFVDTKTNAALIMFGALVILIALGMSFHVAGYRLLSPSEFFAVIVLGLVLIVLGAAKRVLQLRDAAVFQQNQFQEATRLVHEAHTQRVIRGREDLPPTSPGGGSAQ